MTDRHHITPGTPPTVDVDTVTQACVHIDAAANQLETAARGDVFSALHGPAGQLALIRGGVDPTIRAATDPHDRLEFMAHVDRALSLLDAVPASAGPPDLLVWTQRLHDLRDDLQAAWWAQQP